VVVVMEHRTRAGAPKLVMRCDLPLTGKGVVDRVVTDLGVFDVVGDAFELVETAPGVDLDDVREATGAPVVDGRPPPPDAAGPEHRAADPYRRDTVPVACTRSDP
jgi:acyl CoA:acetate/3-ketoacid CoA transferase beta subunit